MFKKNSLVFVLMLVIFLSGCTLPIFGTITEIVYQENTTITSLQDFLSKAQAIADQKIGSGTQAKIIYYSYFDNTFSYEVTFAKDGEFLKDNIIKNIVVSYNEDWQVKKQGSFSGHEAKSVANNKIIAVECNRSVMCSTGTANSMADPKNNIDLSSIKFDLNNLINDKYLTSYNFGFIKILNGTPIGNFSRFRFNAITGEIVDSQAIDINKWYEEQTGSAISNSDMSEESAGEISTSTADVLAQNFNNDLDKDGLTNLQEYAYGTNPNMSDTDGDGNSDLEEINNGYNPKGPGKIISEDCLLNSETDKCYLEDAKNSKDFAVCQKISDEKEVFNCIFSVNLILKNPKICEDLDSIPENYTPDFNNVCLNELIKRANIVIQPYARDARALSDAKQIQTALEIYYNKNGKYPNEVKEGGKIGEFMNIVPSGQKGETENCATNYQYKYTYISDDNYTLSYCIDKMSIVGGRKLNLGINTATPAGINEAINQKLNNGSQTKVIPIISNSVEISGSKLIEYSTNDKNVPRIMMWKGKVNQHWDLEKSLWLTDSDGSSGSNEDKLTYCKKFYPNTISVEEYKNETIDTWKAGGNRGDYKNTLMSYRCVSNN